jgi:hypothetical protein
MATRRNFLDLVPKALAGSFLLNNANLLVPSRELDVPPQEVLISTEKMPEPLGWIGFDYAKVSVAPMSTTQPTFYDELWREIGFRDADPRTRIVIMGYAPSSQVVREQTFFDSAAARQGLRVYFARN